MGVFVGFTGTLLHVIDLKPDMPTAFTTAVCNVSEQEIINKSHRLSSTSKVKGEVYYCLVITKRKKACAFLLIRWGGAVTYVPN